VTNMADGKKAFGSLVQVVALPQPGILEAHVRSHPAVKHLLRDARVGIDQERLVREAFGPLSCRVLLCLRVGNRGVVEVLCEIGEVVSPIGERVDHNILRVGGVLEIPGPRNPQYPGQVGEAVVGPPARRSIQAQQRVPPGHVAGGGLTIIVAVEDVRFLEEPPGVRAVAGENHNGGRHRRRDDREGVRNRGGERLLAVRVRPQIEIGPKPGDARDFRRHAAPSRAVVSHGQSDAHVDVQHARLQNELCGRGDVPVPV